MTYQTEQRMKAHALAKGIGKCPACGHHTYKSIGPLAFFAGDGPQGADLSRFRSIVGMVCDNCGAMILIPEDYLD